MASSFLGEGLEELRKLERETLMEKGKMKREAVSRVGGGVGGINSASEQISPNAWPPGAPRSKAPSPHFCRVLKAVIL